MPMVPISGRLGYIPYEFWICHIDMVPMVPYNFWICHIDLDDIIPGT